MTRAATDTVTRAGFGSIVIGWVGPGSLIDLVSMALVAPAVDVNECELCGTRLKMANCGAALIHSRLTDQPACAARSAKDLIVNLCECSVCNRSPALISLSECFLSSIMFGGSSKIATQRTLLLSCFAIP